MWKKIFAVLSNNWGENQHFSSLFLYHSDLKKKNSLINKPYKYLNIWSIYTLPKKKKWSLLVLKTDA